MNVSFVAVIIGFSLAAGLQRENSVTQEKPATQDMAPCPRHEPHQAAMKDEHQKGVIERGDRVMGFSHDAATHHFRLYADGGAIEVESHATDSAATRDEIRSHFEHIVKMFAAGDFSAPMLIHAQNPPGAETMKRLREAIQYNLENTERGARIRITAKNPEAIEAVHKFLRFQIADHQTGDTIEVSKAP